MTEPWKGLRILVTGAAGGIGALLTRALVASGANVLAHARSIERLTALTGVQAAVADLASLREVKRLSDEVGEVDVLVNNAGIGFGSDKRRREISRDGFELRFAVNYLAPFLLSETLLQRGRVKRAIINVSSIGQQALDLDDLQSERRYDGLEAYRRSKLALIMHTRDLKDRGINATSLHPGTLLDTGMVREAGIEPHGPASRGADNIANVLRHALTEKTLPLYFDETHPAAPNPQANADGVRETLAAYTSALVREFVA